MITVSIVVHKTPAIQLAKALECLLESDITEVYVIDNSPTDELKDICNYNKKIIYSHVPNNGFGAGHNFAIKQALKKGSEFHLVMNADVCWNGDIITPIINYMKADTNIGLISPKTYYPDGQLQYTCRMLPSPTDLFFKRFLPRKMASNRMKKYLLKDYDHDKELNCPYLLGSFMMFRTEALKKVGLFDERFFMYPEDIDITRRIHEGYKTMYWPGVTIIHEHQQASRKNLKMFRIHFVNMIKYFNKWGWFKDSKRKKYNAKLTNSIKSLK